MKVAFAGTPDFAASALQAILDAGFDVPLILTQPDRPGGRGMQLQPSPVKQVALHHGLRVEQPEKLRTEEQQAALREVAPDVLVVAAYGLILPQAVLDLPRFGCVNIHASLLPRWRGAAPIHRAIEAGDAETGITLMQMDAGLDTGAMLVRETLPITAEETCGGLHDKLAALGARMIVDLLPRIALVEVAPAPQPEEGVTYAHKISKAEAALDFRRTAVELERRIRAFDPFPGCSASLREVSIKIRRAHLAEGQGEPGQVLSATDDGIVVACDEGALRFAELQKPGGKRLPAAEFLRGFPVEAGERFALPD
ncbi:methionyl-tRNA formyltransferase [Niveibacterium sp. SC-1]|uniref:methionyl-tRNA formyltransferase n=1 Tax=Niveibacterium sp. SC-1 TaxID=3135646 RepID=UPI00311EBC20